MWPYPPDVQQLLHSVLECFGVSMRIPMQSNDGISRSIVTALLPTQKPDSIINVALRQSDITDSRIYRMSFILSSLFADLQVR